jgi:hypothetical protein
VRVLRVIMVERHEPASAGPAVVTAADMVAGHVSLDVSCLDRLYLNGYVAKLQTPGGVVYFFHHHRGKPIVSRRCSSRSGRSSAGTSTTGRRPTASR